MSAKLNLDRIKLMVSKYRSFFFPATLVAEGPAPPVQAETRGLRELFSTSILRVSYFSF